MKNNTNGNSNNLLQGSIARGLFRLAWPMIVAFAFQTSFNFVDRYFVSQLGSVAIAAIGMAFIVQLILIALGAGIGMGVNSFISRSIGSGRESNAVSAALHSFILALIIGVGFGVTGLLTQDIIYRALGAEGPLLQAIKEYLTVLFYFSPVYLMAMTSNNIFRGWGDTVYPMKFMMTGTLLNVILDPLLIYGLWIFPEMGIKGAALATGLARMLALCYVLWVLFAKDLPRRFRFRGFKFSSAIIRGIFQVGLPASAGQILTSFSLSLIFLLLDPFGTDARAAYTIAFTYEMVAFLPVIGIGQAIAIMTGYNYGARQYDRIKKVYFTGMGLSLGMMFTVSIVILLAPAVFAGVFAQSDSVLKITANALRILAPGYLFNGIFMCTVTSFQGLGLGKYQLYATLMRMFGLMLPLAYAGSRLYGLQGLWGGILTSTVFMSIIMLVWYWYLYQFQLTKGKIKTI
ncbi:MAG: MATE family efflux transporter [Calditrichia bacterium]